MARLPLFPLETVLAPGVTLPLQVFEPRYRQLVSDLLDGPGAPEFGVVTVHTGSEVGPTRTEGLASIGCTAVLQHVDALSPEIMRVKTRGTERFRIRRILDDPAPYLVADVHVLPEEDGDPRTLPGLAREVRERLADYCDLLGVEGPDGFEPLNRRDIEAARRLSYGAAGHMVLPLHERLAVLKTDTAQARLELTRDLLRRETGLIEEFAALPFLPDTSTPSPY